MSHVLHVSMSPSTPLAYLSISTHPHHVHCVHHQRTPKALDALSHLLGRLLDQRGRFSVVVGVPLQRRKARQQRIVARPQLQLCAIGEDAVARKQ